LSSYETETPQWTTVLDIDELSRKEGVSWVWRGSRILPRARDSMSDDEKRVTRALLSFSRSGSDDVIIREFDLVAQDFVDEKTAFSVKEGKTRASYYSRDVLLVASEFDPGSLTDSGFPRTIREWVRGTELHDSPIVFEGKPSDIAVSAYVDDQRVRRGGIYEVRTRALTTTISKFWVRKVKYEHLLKRDDSQRADMQDPPPFKQLEVPGDAEIDFVGNLLMITLRSDWVPEPGKKFAPGSIVYVNAHKFIKYGPVDRIYHVLFQPTERVACENYIVTKGYLILSILDCVKSKLEFYRLEKDANKLRLVGMDKSPQIRAVNIRSVDPYEGDEFWLTTSGYTEPAALYLADASKMDSDDKKAVRKTGLEVYVVRKLKSLPELFDASNLCVTQKLAHSKDGTEIPYFMIAKKGLQLDKKNPTLLYGYGGFGVTLSPHYNAPTGIAWLERGGVYVEANIRGGGEFGLTWHESARRKDRNKAFEDFIAVAEHLVASRVCRPRTLGIRGGSNGGLLVANMYLMRPDLFGAIHCASPILDLKRFKALSGSGALWVHEFGDPDSDDWETYLKEYSPYHNVNVAAEKYPPILLTTHSRDARNHPGHGRKMTKKLWDLGCGKKWPAYYYEHIESDSFATDAKHYAFVTALAHEFLFKTLTK
jgi:prolyl oligopeptidase